MGILKDIVFPLLTLYITVGFFLAHWYATRVSDSLYYWRHHGLQSVAAKTWKALILWAVWPLIIIPIVWQWSKYRKLKP